MNFFKYKPSKPLLFSVFRKIIKLSFILESDIFACTFYFEAKINHRIVFKNIFVQIQDRVSKALYELIFLHE